MMMAAARRWLATRTAVVAVSSASDRWDERQAYGDRGDDDEPSALAKESGQDDTHSGTDEGPPRERGDRDGGAVDLETDIGRGRDGGHDGGADGRECAGERTASSETASARWRGARRGVGRGMGRRQRSHRYAASLRCVARLSRSAITPSIISAKNSFSQSAPLP